MLVSVFAMAPIITVLDASSIAEAHGCALNVSRVHPCIVNGTGYGETLLTMAFPGWRTCVTCQPAAWRS